MIEKNNNNKEQSNIEKAKDNIPSILGIFIKKVKDNVLSFLFQKNVNEKGWNKINELMKRKKTKLLYFLICD